MEPLKLFEALGAVWTHVFVVHRATLILLWIVVDQESAVVVLVYVRVMVICFHNRIAGGVLWCCFN